jgi:6-pyruvoyl-tetrahydropterin synthase
MDFADVDSVVSPLVALLDHRSLNDFIENPTSENLTLWFAAALGALPLAYIEVSETAKSKARWSP